MLNEQHACLTIKIAYSAVGGTQSQWTWPHIFDAVVRCGHDGVHREVGCARATHIGISTDGQKKWNSRKKKQEGKTPCEVSRVLGAGDDGDAMHDNALLRAVEVGLCKGRPLSDARVEVVLGECVGVPDGWRMKTKRGAMCVHVCTCGQC
jgi:hypothetical protein